MIKHFLRDKKDKQKSTPLQLFEEQGYFQTARLWYDDIYTAHVVRAKRYQLAFFSMVGFCAVLSLSIAVMMPLKSTQLIVVHQGESGYAWVETVSPHTRLKASWIKTQAEITHYVETREGYDPLLYPQQTHEVQLLSNGLVEREYVESQTANNPSAPINTLGTKGYRTVTVNSILPLDSESNNTNTHSHKHVNLAQVNFVMTDHALATGKTTHYSYSALIAWEYQGVPATPQAQLHNWDGFQVTKYVVQAVNQGIKRE